MKNELDRPKIFSPFRADLTQTSAQADAWRRNALALSMKLTLDRVNVLEGHTGCVNALSWARDGELLLSGGDDTTVRVWRLEKSSGEELVYPFACQTVVQTGHTANIFNAHMLPYSSRIATVAGDGEVRIFDAGEGVGYSPTGREITRDSEREGGRVLNCHSDRTKKIITEDSPDVFLTVAEDGEVRQHDLRARHICGSDCPNPLIKMNHELSSVSLSTLTPYQIVVAGESPYGYLFDRRQLGRSLEVEWGALPTVAEEDVTHCVRRFGRNVRESPRTMGRRTHITGSRMSNTNGHEVLLSYGSDGVYLFSTRDEPQGQGRRSSGILRSNRSDELQSLLSEDDEQMGDLESSEAALTDEGMRDSDADDEDNEDNEDGGAGDLRYSNVPVVLPRRKFSGACNVRTVKDVNFLGPFDEFVVSGSDDGNFFLWEKSHGELRGIFEGDSAVVNVIEGHPHLPLVAVSGIDRTVKLFGPVRGESAFSRMEIAQDIIRQNARNNTTQRINISSLLRARGIALDLGRDIAAEIRMDPECVQQ